MNKWTAYGDTLLEDGEYRGELNLKHIARVVELLNAREWQPIETAPKDGRANIDLWLSSPDGVEQW